MPFLKPRKISRNQRLQNLSERNGLRHSIFTPTGHRYIGEWKKDQMEGKGTFLPTTGRLYEGDWWKRYRHGFGVFAVRNEYKIFVIDYRGDWKYGMFNGFGARHYADYSYYIGYWKNSKRHGYGQMWYADGAFYDGDWWRDNRHGFGMLVRADGNRYEGQWAYDLKHGKGRFFHLDSGQMQEGIWKRDYCVYSIIIDIPYRQSTVDPTEYPIRTVQVIDINSICNETELRALSSQIKSCLSYQTTKATTTTTTT